MAFLPVAQPRQDTPRRQGISQWSRYGASDPDVEISNPWLRPLQDVAATDRLIWSAIDEGHWRSMEQSPPILASVRKRITLSMSKGWVFQPGTGPQAERLFDVWSAMAERLRFYSFLETGFHSIFTGWHPVECIPNQGPVRVNGSQLRMPRELVAAENAHFQFTLGKDIVHRPPGRLKDWKLWRMKSLGAKLRWCLYQQGIGMPYGESIFGYLTLANYFSRILSSEGLVQLRRGAGVPMIKRIAGGAKVLGADESGAETPAAKKARERVKSEVESFVDQLAGSGVLIVPPGWEVDYFTAQGVFEGWAKIFNFTADEMREAILGGNLIGQAGTGATGSKAAGEVQLQVSIEQARSDARKVAELVRRRLFWPWTVLNAQALGFSTAGLSPTFDDVPLEALPRVEFPSLFRPNVQGFELILKLVKIKPELADQFRINLPALADYWEIPYFAEGEEGPFPDLAQRPPPDLGSDGAEPGEGQPDVEDQVPDAEDGRPGE